MQIPENLRYTASHEWVAGPDDGLVTVGITDYAQDQLGDVVFVELPEVGAEVASGDAVAVVESVKTASDIYTPVAGTVAAVNAELEGTPESINDSPYDAGWLFKIRVEPGTQLDELLDATSYQRTVEAEA